MDIYTVLAAYYATFYLFTLKNSIMGKELFYIRNQGYLGNALLWWHKSRNGYTCDINQALKVDREEAERICKRPEDTAYSCEYIDNNHQAKKLIIDSQYVSKAEQLFSN